MTGRFPRTRLLSEFIASLAEVLVDDEQIDTCVRLTRPLKRASGYAAELRAAKLLMVDRTSRGNYPAAALALSIASELQIAQEESVVRQALRAAA